MKNGGWTSKDYLIFEISRRSVSFQRVPNIAGPQELAGRVYDSLEKLKVRWPWSDMIYPLRVAKTLQTRWVNKCKKPTVFIFMKGTHWPKILKKGRMSDFFSENQCFRMIELVAFQSLFQSLVVISCILIFGHLTLEFHECYVVFETISIPELSRGSVDPGTPEPSIGFFRSPKRSRTKFVPSKKRRPANRSLHLGETSCLQQQTIFDFFFFGRCSILFIVFEFFFGEVIVFFFSKGLVMFVVLRCLVLWLNVKCGLYKTWFFTNAGALKYSPEN